MSIECSEVAKVLAKMQTERGALAKLSRESGVSAPVLGRVASGKQQTLSIEIWIRLYRYAPDVFPPPPLHELSVDGSSENQFTSEALSAYPFLKIIMDHANEAADKNFEQDVFLELCINSLKNELLKVKYGGKLSAKKTG
ncbi:universal stress protein [Desulfonema ishimotonii]|uniref:Universal stress protein n=1 Tax=Desulfonema ishimotonii TaxID=45657 RepID=A0A401G4E0_9BACT|nr:hypothetical protein [Desulfonema ishimotonii]GBC64053.1 universal stress protein [Desulfonema ishimotonii]